MRMETIENTENDGLAADPEMDEHTGRTLKVTVEDFGSVIHTTDLHSYMIIMLHLPTAKCKVLDNCVWRNKSNTTNNCSMNFPDGVADIFSEWAQGDQLLLETFQKNRDPFANKIGTF